MSDSRGRRNPPPTVRRWMLGGALRERRERAGLSREDVAAATEWSSSKVYRLECKGNRVDPRDVDELCKLYGVSASDRRGLVQLARESRQRGWWIEYRDVFSGRFVAFESEASMIHTYEPELVPGLLQTPAYAGAVIRSFRPLASDEEIERRVNARMARQAILKAERAPELSIILGEAALRRCAASDGELAREQFSALLAAGERHNITIRLFPFRAGFHACMEGFAVLGFPHAADLKIAYVGGLMGGVFDESPDGVKQYEDAWKRMSASALSDHETADLIRAELKGLR